MLIWYLRFAICNPTGPLPNSRIPQNWIAAQARSEEIDLKLRRYREAVAALVAACLQRLRDYRVPDDESPEPEP